MGTKETWCASYTESVLNFIEKNVTSERVARKIFHYREQLELFPDMGAPYDPVYPAARPPFPCRSISISDTPFTLFYLKLEEEKRVIIFCIEYDRTDPNSRFAHPDWGLAGF